MTLTRAVPALPARRTVAAAGFHRVQIGFEVVHHDGGFAALRRDDVEVHVHGTRQFAALDLDGNLFAFCARSGA